MASTDIIIHDKKDNVGVVVIEKVAPNQTCNCWIMEGDGCLLYTSPSPRDGLLSRMPSSA